MSMHSYLQKNTVAAAPAPAAEPAAEPVAPVTPAVPANEDLDPGKIGQGPKPVVMIEAQPENLKELVDTYARLEEDAEASADREVVDTVDGMSEVKDAVDEANANGGMSAESACFAAMAIESYSARLGLDHRPLTASIESAIDQPNGKSVISIEELTASLEGVDHVKTEIVKRAISTLYRGLVPLWTSIKVASSGINGIVQKAKKVKERPGVKIRAETAQVADGKEVAKDVGEFMARSVDILRYMVRDFGEQAQLDYESNLKAVEYMDKPNAEEMAKAMPVVLGKWKDPRHKLGEKGTAVLIGGYRLFRDQSLKYHGSDATAKKFDELANLAYPTLVGFQDAVEEEINYDHSAVDIDALSPEEIIKIGEALKKAVENFGFWRVFATKVANAGKLTPIGIPVAADRRNSADGKLFYQKFKADGSSVQEEIATVRDALNTSNRLRFYVSYDAARVLRKVIGIYKKLAKASLAAHVKASLESFDQATADNGVSVNETAPNEPVQSPGEDNTAKTDEVLPKQDGVQDLAVMKQDLSGPTDPEQAQAELQQIRKDQQSDLPAPTEEGGPGLEQRSDTPPSSGRPRPYWFKP